MPFSSKVSFNTHLIAGKALSIWEKEEAEAVMMALVGMCHGEDGGMLHCEASGK